MSFNTTAYISTESPFLHRCINILIFYKIEYTAKNLKCQVYYIRTIDFSRDLSYNFKRVIVMPDVKQTIAQNITELRLLSDMTQAQLGDKLNYSYKTVSKWERGESTPDIEVLTEISDLFGVTLDSLVREDGIADRVDINAKKQKNYNHRAIMYIVEGSIMLVSLLAFIITSLIIGKNGFQILYFVYAVPIVFIVKLVLNSVWFNPRHNYYIVSALMWSILAAIHISFLYFKINVGLIYLLGVAGQLIIIICAFISRPFKLFKKH